MSRYQVRAGRLCGRAGSFIDDLVSEAATGDLGSDQRLVILTDWLDRAASYQIEVMTESEYEDRCVRVDDFVVVHRRYSGVLNFGPNLVGTVLTYCMP